MPFRPIERAAAAFQESVTAPQVEVMCRAVPASEMRLTAAVELGLGLSRTPSASNSARCGR